MERQIRINVGSSVALEVLAQLGIQLGIDIYNTINKKLLKEFQQSPCSKGGKHKIRKETVGPPTNPFQDPPVIPCNLINEEVLRDPPTYYICTKCGESYWTKYSPEEI